LTSSVRLVAALVACALMLAWTAPPLAAEPQASSPTRPIAASVAAQVAALKPAPRLLQTQPAAAGATNPDSRPFLRTPLGVVAVLATAAGLAYAVKTAFKDNDPVHSPVR